MRVLSKVGARLGRIFFRAVLEQFSLSGGGGHPHPDLPRSLCCSETFARILAQVALHFLEKF